MDSRLYSRSLTPVSVFNEEILPKGNLIERTRKEAEELAGNMKKPNSNWKELMKN
jgi:hypothetical protein